MKTLDKIRNIGIIAHVDAGKTTATERILYYSGLTHKLGNVDSGDTVMDTDPQESKRGITINSSAITTQWVYPHKFGKPIERSQKYQVNIIDTPGHVDFTAEVERSLRILDGAVALFCAKSGVEPQTENVWRQADKYNVPRVCFINKMDREGADFYNVVEEIQDNLGAKPIVVQLPYGSAREFKGVIDLISMEFLVWSNTDKGKSWETLDIPRDLYSEAKRKRDILIEQVVEFDDNLLNSYLNEETIKVEDLISAIRKGTLKSEIVPVLCGAAYRHIGVQPLLDAVVNFLPSPEDKVSIEGENPVTMEKETRLLKMEESFSGLVFKVISDPYAGKLAMVRIYSGKLIPGTSVLNVRSGKQTRVSRILRVHADKFKQEDNAIAGEIVAVVGLKQVKTGDALSDPVKPIVLQSMDFPEPVIGYALEPKENKDEKTLGVALSKLMAEDPTLKVVIDPQTNQTILRGMGELHLEVTLEKMKQEYDVFVNTGAPKVAFKETLRTSVIHRKLFKKQSGGNGQFADITFEIGPGIEKQPGLNFIDEIKGGVIPKPFINSVKAGFEEAMKTGVLGGYPVESMSVRLFDGNIHREDSRALDFEHAAIEGFKEAARKCNPALLEPIMNVEVLAPEVHTGKVTGDLNRRRGLIKQMDVKGALQIIKADVPLNELFGYIMDLRGLTAGRASATMIFSHYSLLSESLANNVLNNN